MTFWVLKTFKMLILNENPQLDLKQVAVRYRSGGAQLEWRWLCNSGYFWSALKSINKFGSGCSSSYVPEIKRIFSLVPVPFESFR